MAVRFNPSGTAGKYTRTTNLPANTAFTLMAWAYIRTSSTGGDLNTILRIGAAGGGGQFNLCENNGKLSIYDVSVKQGTATFGLNTWVHVAVTCDGTTALGYFNGVLDNTVNGPTLPTVASITLGDSYTNDPLTGDIAGAFVYGAVLTPAEILQQMRQVAPIRTTNLLAWLPMSATGDGPVDYSGGGDFTATGGTSTSDNPPVPWRTGRARVVYVPTGGGSFTKSLAGTVGSSGAITRAAAVAKAGTAASAGALARAAAIAKAGAASLAGAIAKLVGKPPSGSIASSGAMTKFKVALLTLTGTVGLSASIARAIAKPLAGSSSSSGALAKLIAKPASGSITLAGLLANILVGVVGLSGALVKLVLKSASGAVASSAALTRANALARSGAVAPAGAIAKAAAKPSSGTVASSGALAKLIGKAVAGGVTLAGALARVKVVLLALAGALTPHGAIARDLPLHKGVLLPS